MGLIHSRAAKKRNKAEAKLLDEQRKAARDERVEQRRQARADARADREDLSVYAQREQRLEKAREQAGDSAWRQPTIGDALATALSNRRRRRAEGS